MLTCPSKKCYSFNTKLNVYLVDKKNLYLYLQQILRNNKQNIHDAY